MPSPGQPAAAEGGDQEDPSVTARYKFGKTLGKGTFGKVKLALNMKNRVKVAVKILQKAKIVNENDVVRSEREIKLWSPLQHPNIAKIYDVMELEDKIYIFMEYCPGGELFDHIVKNKRLGEPSARHIFRQILSAIGYCHTNFILHRDLKPENLLLDEDKNIKLVDFGFSNTFAPSSMLETYCGSPAYASPEMVLGKPYVGPEVDIWSLGVILFAMVCGWLPFDHKNVSQLYRLIIEGQYVIPAFLSPTCQSIISRMIVVDPKQRATLDELLTHPWTIEGTNGPPSLFVEPQPRVRVPNQHILARLTGSLNANAAELSRKLAEGIRDDQTCMYFLLRARKDSALAVQDDSNEVLEDGDGSAPCVPKVVEPPGASVASPASSAPMGEPRSPNRAVTGRVDSMISELQLFGGPPASNASPTSIGISVGSTTRAPRGEGHPARSPLGAPMPPMPTMPPLLGPSLFGTPMPTVVPTLQPPLLVDNPSLAPPAAAAPSTGTSPGRVARPSFFNNNPMTLRPAPGPAPSTATAAATPAATAPAAGPAASTNGATNGSMNGNGATNGHGNGTAVPPVHPNLTAARESFSSKRPPRSPSQSPDPSRQPSLSRGHMSYTGTLGEGMAGAHEAMTHGVASKPPPGPGKHASNAAINRAAASAANNDEMNINSFLGVNSTRPHMPAPGVSQAAMPDIDLHSFLGVSPYKNAAKPAPTAVPASKPAPAPTPAPAPAPAVTTLAPAVPVATPPPTVAAATPTTKPVGTPNRPTFIAAPLTLLDEADTVEDDEGASYTTVSEPTSLEASNSAPRVFASTSSSNNVAPTPTAGLLSTPGTTDLKLTQRQVNMMSGMEHSGEIYGVDGNTSSQETTPAKDSPAKDSPPVARATTTATTTTATTTTPLPPPKTQVPVKEPVKPVAFAPPMGASMLGVVQPAVTTAAATVPAVTQLQGGTAVNTPSKQQGGAGAAANASAANAAVTPNKTPTREPLTVVITPNARVDSTPNMSAAGSGTTAGTATHTSLARTPPMTGSPPATPSPRDAYMAYASATRLNGSGSPKVEAMQARRESMTPTKEEGAAASTLRVIRGPFNATVTSGASPHDIMSAVLRAMETMGGQTEKFGWVLYCLKDELGFEAEICKLARAPGATRETYGVRLKKETGDADAYTQAVQLIVTRVRELKVG